MKHARTDANHILTKRIKLQLKKYRISKVCKILTYQQEFSHMVAWSSFNMGKDNIFSIDSQHI